jgi:hypothetical protein
MTTPAFWPPLQSGGLPFSQSNGVQPRLGQDLGQLRAFYLSFYCRLHLDADWLEGTNADSYSAWVRCQPIFRLNAA